MPNRITTIALIAAFSAGGLLLSSCSRPKPVVAPEVPPAEADSAAAVPAPGDAATTSVTEEPTVAVADLPEGGVGTSDLPADLAVLNKAGYLSDVFFDTNKYDLRDDARDALAANAAWLRTHSSISVLIEGHCDERNTEEFNLALGWRRAHAVKDYLVSLGIAANRLETLSLGEERPFANCQSESCWSQNRRGHLVITAR